MRLQRVKVAVEKFYQFLDRPLFGWSRLALALLVIPLALSFTAPLWRIQLEAPQYPNGLHMDIYSYKVDGGNNGHDIKEINVLNHYIGMAPIDEAALADLAWIPLAIGALIILALRVAVIGNVRSLVDLTVITFYIGLFSMGRFAYRMYVFGHNLDPTAPVNVDPFMPPLLGSKQIANFTAHSGPKLGTFYVAIFATGVLGLLTWHLIAGRIQAARADHVAAAS